MRAVPSMSRWGLASALAVGALASLGCGGEAEPEMHVTPMQGGAQGAPPAPIPIAPVAPILENTRPATRISTASVDAELEPLPEPPPAESGGGGGGGRGARARRAADALRGMSPADAFAMIQQARQLAQGEQGDDGCGRLLASFHGLTESTGRPAAISDSRFSSICARMPEQMQTCFEDPAERNPQEQERCLQIFGTDDVFNPQQTQPPRLPPGTRAPSADELRQAQELERQAGRGGRR